VRQDQHGRRGHDDPYSQTYHSHSYDDPGSAGIARKTLVLEKRQRGRMLRLTAIVVLVGVMKYPRRVHPLTGVLLTLVAGTLLWANLRPTDIESSMPGRLTD